MKRIKTVAIVTAIAMLIAMMPMMSFASTSAPAKVSLTSVTQCSYDQSTIVKWKKVAKADGYQVARKLAGGEYKVVKTIKNVKTVHYYSADLKAGKTYYYKVRAYKKSGKKKVYGKYSESKSIKICYDEPKFKINSISNTNEAGKVHTVFNITINENCKSVYISNKSDDTNGVTRYTGVNKDVYDTAVNKLEDLMADEDSDYTTLADDILKALEGSYSIKTAVPDKIYVNGVQVKKGYIKELKPGKTYNIDYASANTNKIAAVKLDVTLDTNKDPVVNINYAKCSINDMYDADFAKYWKTQGIYQMALKYRGDYYDSTMNMDYETNKFVNDIL